MTIGELFFLGLIATCFGFMLWSYLLRRYPAYLVTPFSLVIPISGLISTGGGARGAGGAKRCCSMRGPFWGRMTARGRGR